MDFIFDSFIEARYWRGKKTIQMFEVLGQSVLPNNADFNYTSNNANVVVEVEVRNWFGS